MKSFSHVRLFATPWTVAHQAPPSWDFPGKNNGVGCHFLLQEIFLTQGLNPGLLHCRQTLYRLSHTEFMAICYSSNRKQIQWIYIYVHDAMDINICMYVCGLGFSVFNKIRIIQYLMFCSICFSNKNIVMGGILCMMFQRKKRESRGR